MRRLVPTIVPALVLLAMVLALFWPVWSPIAKAGMAFKYDPLWSYWGDLQFQVNSLAHGHLPLWNPYERMGYPAYADLQGGLFYPLSWPFIVLGLAAGKVAWWAIAGKIIGHFWLAAGGAYFFCRRRGLPVPACYAAAVLFVLAYPNSHHVGSILVWSLAWAPWMLAAIDALGERPSASRGAWLGFTSAMSLLAGGPASFWYAALCVLLYGAWSLWSHARAIDGLRPAASAPHRQSRRGPPGRAYWIRAGKALAVAGGIFLGITLVQILATGELVGQSVRAERDLAFVTEGGLAIKDIAGMFIPRVGPYLGWLGMIGVAVALTVKLDARKLVLLAIVIFGFALAIGDGGPFLGSAASALSPFTLFRRSHRYASIAAVAYPLLAAEGLALLMTLKDAVKLRRGLLIFCGVGALILGCGFVTQLADKQGTLRDGFAFGLVSVVLSAWLAFELVRRSGGLKRALAAAVPLLLLADVWLAREPALRLNYTPRPDLRADARMQGLPGLPGDVRIFDREVLSWRPGTRLGLRDFGGYEDDPLALVRYAGYLQDAVANPRLLAHANVRYVLEGARKPLKGDPAAFERVGKEKAVKDPAPAVYWVDAAVLVADAEAARKKLAELTPGQAAVLESPTLTEGDRALAPEGEPGRAVPGKLVTLEPNLLHATVDAPALGVVVLTEAYYPHGWRATVDGENWPIVPVNGVMRGLVVGPGHHDIVMRFTARRTGVLFAVELLALGLVIVLWLRGRRRPVV